MLKKTTLKSVWLMLYLLVFAAVLTFAPIEASADIRPDDYVRSTYELSAAEGLATVITSLEYGNLDRAAALGKNYYRQASTSLYRFRFAKQIAKAELLRNRPRVALYWLMLAYDDAPFLEAQAQIIQDIYAIRQSLPYTISLQLGFGGETNANNGAANEKLIIEGLAQEGLLDEEAQEKAGQQYSGSLKISKNINNVRIPVDAINLIFEYRDTYLETGDSSYRLNATLQALGKIVFPGKQIVDYAIGYTKALDDDSWGAVSSISLTHSFKGYPLCPCSIAWGQDKYHQTGGSPIIVRKIEIERSMALNNQRQARFALQASKQAGSTQNTSYDSLSFKASISDIIKSDFVKADMNYSLGLRRYDAYQIGPIDVPDGRNDVISQLSVTGHLNGISVLAASPFVSLGYQKSHSNISRFSYENYSLEAGFRFNF